MPGQSVIKRFESYCVAFDTWVIAYRSSSLLQPLYLLWYTDNATGDGLLMYKNSGVFATGDLANLANSAESLLPSLKTSPRLTQWIEQVSGLEATVSNQYDMDYIHMALRRKKLSLKAMDALSNFIDLFGDYANSLEDTSHLQVFREHPVIEAFIAHYYQYIFWPRMHKGVNFRDTDRPEMEVDHQALIQVFLEMKAAFEAGLQPLR